MSNNFWQSLSWESMGLQEDAQSFFSSLFLPLSRPHTPQPTLQPTNIPSAGSLRPNSGLCSAAASLPRSGRPPSALAWPTSTREFFHAIPDPPFQPLLGRPSRCAPLCATGVPTAGTRQTVASEGEALAGGRDARTNGQKADTHPETASPERWWERTFPLQAELRDDRSHPPCSLLTS